MTVKRECSDEVELRNGKSNPFGWSSHELWHHETKIGSLHCGEPKLDDPRYSAVIECVDDRTQRARFYVEVGEPNEAEL
jgi:hypothetical protein